VATPRLRLPLETARLVLRELVDDDLDALHAWRRHPGYRRHLPMPRQTRAAVEAELRAILSDQADPLRPRYLLAAIERTSGRMIGEAILKLGPSPRHRQAEIGWAVAEGAKGRGYATEIGRALLDAAFGRLRLHRVFAMCSVENLASRRVMEKLGMREEALFREHFRARGRWWSSHLYAMLRSERTVRGGNAAVRSASAAAPGRR
jgi:[ribosomal protein S5]-alanine N-acetyltransferase